MVTARSSAGALLVVTDGKIAFANESAAGLLREGSSASDWLGCPDPRHADGSGPLVFESSPLAAAHGTPSELVSVRTLTRGPEVQEEALAALDRFRAAIDLAADAIVLIDYDTHRYLDVNATACRMFGYSREEMLSLGPQRVNSRLREDERRRAFARLLELPGQHEVMETVHTRSDGAQFHAEVSRRAVQAGGRWVVIAAIRDISFRKKTESELHRHLLELQRSNDELERFAYVASHDLSEPLRMIAGYMALLRRRYSPLLDDDGREFIDYAVDGAERMKRLIDDLLLYSRTGRTANPPQALSLESLMGDVTRNLERLIEEKGATVEIAQLPTVLGDRTMLTQLLQNLVGNALKFAANGRNPVVRVACETDGAGWRVGVADNGIGIEPRYFERIFLLFQRLHGRDQYEGTGIGLAVCKKIVDQIGGRIWCESVPGKGTTFFFTLPGEARPGEARPGS